MARYLPQHLFNGLVVARLMADACGQDDIFSDLVRRYGRKYPDDDTTALISDVTAAASEGRYVVKVVRDAPGHTGLTEIEVLQAIMEIFAADAERGKPLWRRMLADYVFNSQPVPIPDRIERAREHLIRAERELVARRARQAAGSAPADPIVS